MQSHLVRKSANLRIWSEVDVALFPVLTTAERLLEFDSIRDVAETKIDRAHLFIRRKLASINGFLLGWLECTCLARIQTVDDLLDFAPLSRSHLMKSHCGPLCVNANRADAAGEFLLDVFA